MLPNIVVTPLLNGKTLPSERSIGCVSLISPLFGLFIQCVSIWSRAFLWRTVCHLPLITACSLFVCPVIDRLGPSSAICSNHVCPVHLGRDLLNSSPVGVSEFASDVHVRAYIVLRVYATSATAQSFVWQLLHHILRPHPM